jgi:peptidyl-prolyl cis-trans isomerase SurA
MEDYAKEKLAGIRKDIVEGGKSFSLMASLYGMDGTKEDGGNMILNKDEMDPIFTSAAMKLQPGEISPVFRGKFGYHIVQMVAKTSNTTAKVKHIIIIPELTTADFEKTKALADSVAQLLQEGKMTFVDAVKNYTSDENAKMTGGMIVHPQTYSSKLQMDELDNITTVQLEGLPLLGYSKPFLHVDRYTQQRTIRIIHLKERTEPHLLNLKDDYAEIQQNALVLKQSEVLKRYINQKIPEFYINVDSEYAACEKIKPWLNKVVHQPKQ